MGLLGSSWRMRTADGLALGPGGESSSHGISCNTLTAKLIQIGLDMNI